MALRFFHSRLDAWAILAIVAVALLWRLGFEFRVAPFVSKDSQSYFLPAWDLVHGGEFQLGLRRTPGYPLFLAAVLVVLGDDLRGITLAQHLLGAGTAALTYWLGRLTFGRAAGLAAGLLVALSAPLITYEHYVLSEAVFAFVLTGALVALVAAWRRPSGRGWLLGGVLVGACAMVRPVGQAILPLALLAALVARPRPARQSLRDAALVLLGFALLVVPWTIRNQLAYNLATPSTFGRTLIARTAYYDRGFVFYDPERAPADADPGRVQALRIVQQGRDRRQSDGEIAGRLRAELGLDPVEVNALMRDVALEAILRQPLYFVEGTLRFGLRIFNGAEVRIRDHDHERRDVVWDPRTAPLLPTGPASEEDFRAASGLLRWYQPAAFAPLQLLLFALGLVAALVVPAWRPAALPALAVITLVLASGALDGPQERYRYPADPAIGVLVAGGAVALVTLVRLGIGGLGRAMARRRLALSRSLSEDSVPHRGRVDAALPRPRPGPAP
jgi:hypothetical protein